MAVDRICPECRSPLGADAPLGLCPRCVLGLGFGGGGVDSETTAYVSPAPAAEASPESLSGLFPQLEILEPLGRGGMGMVYRARQIKLDRLVALKVIRPESAGDALFAERFHREARAMARLGHPHIVTIHDFGEAGGLYYLVMELVEGGDLRRRLEDGPLAREDALAIAGQICDALEFAHGRGIIHRDIKPENVLLAADAINIKLADFGLAKVMLGEGDARGAMTATRQVLGTPRYMAPEQFERPREVDHRADLYAVGVMLYEMLIGDVPYGRFDLPSERSECGEDIDKVVTKALARDPADRYQSAGELRAALAELAAAYRPAPKAARKRQAAAQKKPKTEKVPAWLVSSVDATGVSGFWEENWIWILFVCLCFVLPWISGLLTDNLPQGPSRFWGYAAVAAIAVNLFTPKLLGSEEGAGCLIFAGLFLVLPAFANVIHENLPQGGQRLIGYAVLAALGLNALAWRWIRPGVRAGRMSRMLSSPVATRRDDPMLRLSLRRPTLGLVLAGALDGIMVLPLIGYETTRESRVFLLGLEMAPDRAATITIAALIVGLVLLVCALVLLVRPSRTLGWIAALAALVPHGPGSLVAIPSGVWMLAVLTGEDGGSDEARFEKPQPEPGPSAIAGDSRPGEPY